MDQELERPLLAGGEKLRDTVERVSGGGGKYWPQTPSQAQVLLAPKVSALVAEVTTMPTELRGRQVIFQATLLPNFLAGSYFPSDLLQATGLQAVGSRKTTGTLRTERRETTGLPTKALLLAGNDENVHALKDLIVSEPPDQPTATWKNITEFSDIRLAEATDVVRMRPGERETQGTMTWEAVLHKVPGTSNREMRQQQDEIFAKWVAYVESLGGEIAVRYRRTVEGLTFVPVALPVEALPAVTRFNPLRAIRPMPKLRPITVTPLRTAGAPRIPSPHAPQVAARTNTRVAVFDGGVEPNSAYLSPFCRLIDATNHPPVADYLNHGSVVTNAVLYGYVAGASTLPVPDVYVDHYRVLPPETSGGVGDVDLYWILDQIVDQVRAHDYPIVNLSLGPNDCVDEDDEPHRWTAELDLLARERDVLFVSAVGNNGEQEGSLGLNRVQVPSDMVNGLGIGSCTSRHPETPWTRSANSAVGPGRWGARIRPSGVCFGGSPNGTQFYGIGHGDAVASGYGTSYATPLVVHGLAELTALLGPSRTSLSTLQAFALHLAERKKRLHVPQEVGFGRLPESYAGLFECEENEVTLLYEDVIRRDEVVALQLPFPEGIDPGSRISFKWTLSYVAATDPSEPLDYTRAGIEMVFRPHAYMYGMNDPVSGRRVAVVDVRHDEDQISSLLDLGCTPSSHPVSYGTTRLSQMEQGRRDAGKWETSMQMRVSRLAADLAAPRLYLQYLAREGGVLVRDTADDLSYTLLVTVTAPLGQPLYHSVRQQFRVLTPVLTRISVMA